jgi:predicted lipoprotein with Yx(FWY)xxD motif
MHDMKRLLIYAATVGAAVILAACASSGSSNTASGGARTVSVKQVDGVGNVLVDPTGMVLYSPDEEVNGKVLCTGACTSFWTPLAATDRAPTAAPGVPQLGVIDRPDGTMQVTADGKPLYTFTEDSPGDLKGNGFSDDFDSQHFTWHAVLANGTTASGGSTPGAGTTPSYGY